MRIFSSESWSGWGLPLAVMISVGAHAGVVWYSQHNFTPPELVVTPGKTSILLNASPVPSVSATLPENEPPPDLQPLTEEQLASITTPAQTSEPLAKRERSVVPLEALPDTPLELTVPRYVPETDYEYVPETDYESPLAEEVVATPTPVHTSEPSPITRREPTPQPQPIPPESTLAVREPRSRPKRLFQPETGAVEESSVQRRLKPLLQEQPQTTVASSQTLPQPDTPQQKRVDTEAEPPSPSEAPAPEFVTAASPASTPYQGVVDDLPRKLSGNVSPAYPPKLYAAGISGRVELIVTVSHEGQVTNAKVHRSSGHSEFDQSALQTVKSWRFRPAKVNGRPVTYRIRVPVRFQIRQNTAF